jgi:hypothetical protein
MSAENWETLLKSEGLGVIEISTEWAGVGGARRPKSKWARLDAEFNNLQNRSEFMTESPETAKGVETRPSGKQGGMPDDMGYGEEFGDDVWDDLALSLTATSREAAIADRRRGSICGLDHEFRIVPLKPRRKHREPGKVWRQRILDHILGDYAAKGDGPLRSDWRPPMPPYAHTDAGNGPLSIVDQPAPDFGSAPRIDEPVRMSPIVDTMTYPPGRGPYQTGRYMATNSDITG